MHETTLYFLKTRACFIAQDHVGFVLTRTPLRERRRAGLGEHPAVQGGVREQHGAHERAGVGGRPGGVGPAGGLQRPQACRVRLELTLAS